MAKITINTLNKAKQNGEKFAVVAAYDACWSRLINEAEISVILVGDSLGMVLQGHDSTLPVRMDDMVYHTACAARGNTNSLLIADMPFGSYSTKETAIENATRLMQAGAHMVKLEGGAWLFATIEALTQCGIPVCGHLGLTPQSVNTLGGYRVQGREPEKAKQILADAKGLCDAGATLLVLECVPQQLSADISKAIPAPVIGIGAGPDTDAQVLVIHDMLGISERSPKFSKNFLENNVSILEALKAYNQAVIAGDFPAEEHCFD